MTDVHAQQNARLLALLEPVLATVAALQPASRQTSEGARALLDALEHDFPWAGEHAQTIAAELRRGVAEGWLCDRGEPQARFSRIAKPGPQTHDLSVDIVALQGPALRHTHPAGEVTLACAADPGATGCTFDGNPPGWVFMPPGSTHTPTVDGPMMHLLYFLPGGAMQWHRD